MARSTFALRGRVAWLAMAGSLAAGQVAAQEVEVLHWWTSGGEAAALNVLKEDLQKKGIGWQDMPVAGGSGVQAMTVLRARVTSGNPPTAVQMLGFDILDWAEQGAVADLTETATAEGWQGVVPDAIQRFSTYDGKWIAAPVNVHSTNWVWANKKIFDELQLSEPTDWDSFIATLDKIKEAGYIALAHGGQDWQDATVWEHVVLATGGSDFYQKAVLERDPEALGSDTMVTVFERMEQLRGYVDDNFSGRDWNLATAMVINGDAGMQMMGDWAKGEFLNSGKVEEQDFMCFRTPGTAGNVLFNSDQFVMFQVGEDKREAQIELAKSVMSPDFQVSFNLVKGSVPARTDVSDEQFGACGKKGMAQLKEAAASGTLMGSIAHGHGGPSAIKNAVFDVVTGHFNGDFEAAEAAEALVDAVAAAE